MRAIFKPSRRRAVATAKRQLKNLNEIPEIVTWPETHYVYIEKVGPFQTTARQAWQSLHSLVPKISEHNKIKGYTSLYKVEPQIYRAGVVVEAAPQNLPEGVQYTKFKGGKYSRFVLNGSYAQLPEACGRVFEIVAEKRIPVRDDFGIENYVTDPRTTPEDQLVTEILVPTV
jgi:DNA gyrase inhibitor GyrI